MGKFVITEEEKKHILGLYEQKIKMPDIAAASDSTMTKYNKPQRIVKSVDAPGSDLIYSEDLLNDLKDDSIDVDNVVDLISLSLDVIPGTGNLLSSAIDVLHSASYYYRYIIENNEDKKMENLFLAITNLLFSVVPIGGNIYAMGIKKFINKTPKKIKELLGIPVGIELGKDTWNYCLIAWLKKYYANDLESELSKSINKIKNLINNETLKYISYTSPVLLFLFNYSEELILFLKNLKELSRNVNPKNELYEELSGLNLF
jgi:hypothetical protein